ncbi:MAG TPA: chemotaxis protein CheW [Pyrinomonadaceae bacterium]|nr:chemotaxis protein CheW [Pyrinomonadaceae bacterium]
MESDLLTTIDESGVSDTLTDDTQPEKAGEKFVSFSLGNAMFAIRASSVAEVSHPLPLTPLPGSPKTLIGIAPLRGEIVAMIDLRTLVDEHSQNAASKPKTLILKANGNETPVAFLVDKIGEIITLPLENVRVIANGSGGFISGETSHEAGMVRILDCGRLSSVLAPA